VSKFPTQEVEDFQEELRKMDASLVDGKFVVSGDSDPRGQEITVGLLHRCLLWADITLEKCGYHRILYDEQY
jgi:hypothetical protein